MFDHQQLNSLHTIRPTLPYLRPDLMRAEHVERLRRRADEQQANLWQSAWQNVVHLAERIALRIGTGLLSWAERRKLQLGQEDSPA